MHRTEENAFQSRVDRCGGLAREFVLLGKLVDQCRLGEGLLNRTNGRGLGLLRRFDRCRFAGFRSCHKTLPITTKFFRGKSARSTQFTGNTAPFRDANRSSTVRMLDGASILATSVRGRNTVSASLAQLPFPTFSELWLVAIDMAAQDRTFSRSRRRIADVGGGRLEITERKGWISVVGRRCGLMVHQGDLFAV